MSSSTSHEEEDVQVEQHHHETVHETVHENEFESEGTSSTLPGASVNSLPLIDPVEVNTLAQIATRQSQKNVPSAAVHRLASIAEHDARLNPQSERFDLQRWIAAAMQDIGPERGQKKMGVVFKDLDVYGSGSELQFQGTVSSMFTAPFRIADAFRKSPKKRILKSFNGLMKGGEMLLVLGRPGAGCSTMMKTITGELYGLEKGENSTIHYNGRIFLALLQFEAQRLIQTNRYSSEANDQGVQG